MTKKLDKILKKLNIDETFNKKPSKSKVFTHIDDLVPHKKHLNYMADLLKLPKTEDGYDGLLVVVDLGNHMFDIEPIKSKTSSSVLQAYLQMIKRSYIKDPYYTIQTDNGGEFLGEFHEYFKKKNIYHKTTRPYRHKQNSMVESLNRMLGRLFNGYMNQKEIFTGKVYNEWTDVLPIVRKELNDYRRRKEQDQFNEIYESQIPNPQLKSKFKVGDIVFVRLEFPENALGHKQTHERFREGDYTYSRIPREILNVYEYPNNIIRYLVEGYSNTFTTEELLKSDEKESKYVVQKIIGKKRIKNKIHYLVHWKGYLKKDATWHLKTELLKDGVDEYIEEYENELKNKNKK